MFMCSLLFCPTVLSSLYVYTDVTNSSGETLVDIADKNRQTEVRDYLKSLIHSSPTGAPYCSVMIQYFSFTYCMMIVQ